MTTLGIVGHGLLGFVTGGLLRIPIRDSSRGWPVRSASPPPQAGSSSLPRPSRWWRGGRAWRPWCSPVSPAGNGAAAYALATSFSAEYHGAAAGRLNTAQIGTAVVVALASHGSGPLDQRAGWLTAATAGALVIAAILALTHRARDRVGA